MTQGRRVRSGPLVGVLVLLGLPAMGGSTAVAATQSPIGVFVDDVSVLEPDVGSVGAQFVVTLTGPSTTTVTVKATTANGTALSGSDYTSVALTTLTFAPGQTTATVPITVLGDLQREGRQTLLLKLSSPAGAVLADSQGVLTIIDDEGPIAVHAADTSVVEANDGMHPVEVPLRLSAAPAAGESVTFKVATANGSALAGSDYAALPLTTVTFIAGETVRMLSVLVNGDTTAEKSEAFSIRLSAPSANALIADSVASVNIVDDDAGSPVWPLPALYVDDVAVVEGDTGPSTARFPVVLVPTSDQVVTVRAATADGSAVAGRDFAGLASTTVTFNPSQTVATADVVLTPDALTEGDESFSLKLSSPLAAVLGDGQGTALIIDDDPPRSMYVRDISVIETNATATATFTVVVSSPPAVGQSVSVKIATADGTATAGSDYTALPPTILTFDPGESIRTVSVDVSGDGLHEGDESFVLNLSSPSGATLGDAQAVAYVIDDEGRFSITVNDVSVQEGDGGTTTATVVVSLSAVPGQGQAVTVKAVTANVTALAGSDYLALPSTTLTFGPGQTTRTVAIGINGDVAVEKDETFSVKLSSPSANALLGDPVGQVTIVNDDVAGGSRFRFADVTGGVGLDTLGNAYSHSAAWGDVNLDGRADLFVGTFADKARTDGQPASPDRLLLNLPSGFIDAGQPAVQTAGRASGAVLADLDGDGDLDLVVANNRKLPGTALAQIEPNHLFRNDDGRFLDISEASGIRIADRNGRAIGVLDYDGDGRLDLFMVADSLTGSGTRVSKLLRNTGGLTFQDVTTDAGLPPDLAGLGVAVGDANGDGWPDIVMTGGVSGSGSYAAAYLFVNRRDGTFRDASTPNLRWSVQGDEDWTAGAAWGDLNRDDRLDLVVTHHFGSAAAAPVAPRVYLNRGNDDHGDPVLEEAAGLPGIPSKAPHVEIVDFDNDGWPDVFLSVMLDGANGSLPYILGHQGLAAGGVPAFLAPPGAVASYAPGAPTNDFDGDGRVDVLMEGFDVQIPPSLLRNVTVGGHWLGVRVATPTNSMGLGARVRVFRAGMVGQPGGLLMSSEISVGNGFSSAQQAMAHIGVGTELSVDVQVTLPFGGPVLTRIGVAVDQVVDIQS